MPNISPRDAMADFFRQRGWNPLPSSEEEKKPLCRFKPYWDTPAPAELFAQFPSRNLQLMTGRLWRLLVIDLDKPPARAWWDGLHYRKPRTWATHSGGDGLHVWFTLPQNYPHPLPKAVLWRPDNTKPRMKGEPAAERLCDLSLIMTPPSIHPSGRPYRFLDAPGYMPFPKLSVPAMCPDWLLSMRPLEIPRPAPKSLPMVRPEALALNPDAVGRYRAHDVTASIPDIIGLVATWGIRFAPAVDREWQPCHAFDREDTRPSAAVSRRTGAYVDKGSGLRLGLFDLAATLGVGRDWTEAVAILGERYRARRVGGAA